MRLVRLSGPRPLSWAAGAVTPLVRAPAAAAAAGTTGCAATPPRHGPAIARLSPLTGWAAARPHGTVAATAPGGGLAPADCASPRGERPPYDPALLIPRDVWECMGPRAQAAAATAGRQRAALAAVPLLSTLGETLPAAPAAERLGVTVLGADDDGAVLLGMCTLPRLDHDVQRTPKSE